MTEPRVDGQSSEERYFAPKEVERAGLQPIRVPCEAAGSPPIRVTTDPATFSYNGGMLHGMCPMCGQFVPIPLGHDINVMPPHQRDDVLAMIRRGDFG